MKLNCLFSLVATFVPAFALAVPCFTITDRANRTTYQSTDTPIDLSHQILDEMRRKFPGQHMVMSNVESCPFTDMSLSIADNRAGSGGLPAKAARR